MREIFGDTKAVRLLEARVRRAANGALEAGERQVVVTDDHIASGRGGKRLQWAEAVASAHHGAER